jgi:hypothetical protein
MLAVALHDVRHSGSGARYLDSVVAAALARSAGMGGCNFETLTHVSHTAYRRELLVNTCSSLYIYLLCVIVVSSFCA